MLAEAPGLLWVGPPLLPAPRVSRIKTLANRDDNCAGPCVAAFEWAGAKEGEVERDWKEEVEEDDTWPTGIGVARNQRQTGKTNKIVNMVFMFYLTVAEGQQCCSCLATGSLCVICLQAPLYLIQYVRFATGSALGRHR